MAGTLLLDFDTVASEPDTRFFSMLALVERAAGRRVVVFDGDPKRKDGEYIITMQLLIPCNQYIQWSGEPIDGVQTLPAIMRHDAKLNVAKALRNRAPVIWIDLDFGDWKGRQNPDALQNVVALNWAKVLRMTAAGPGNANIPTANA